LIGSFFAFIKNRLYKKSPIYLFLACWIIAALLVFQPSHSKLVSYIFPLFPALALLAGDYIWDRIDQEAPYGKSQYIQGGISSKPRYSGAKEKKKDKWFSRLFRWTWYVLVLIASAMLAAVIFYEGFVSPKLPLYLFIVFIFGLLLAMFLFMLRRDWLKASGIAAVFVPLIIFGMVLLKADLEPYISSKAAGEYLVKNVPADSVILCSKPFVRGIKFYTDRKVAAIGTPFFSPHPIELIDSPEKMINFLSRQSLTYAVVKSSDLEEIENAAGSDFRFLVAERIGDEYILLIRPAKK
jgi:hypothetical protein